MQGVFKDRRAVTREGKAIIQVVLPMPSAPAGPRGPAFRANPRCKVNRDATPQHRGFLIDPRSQTHRAPATASALPLAITGHSQITTTGAILAQIGNYNS